MFNPRFYYTLGLWLLLPYALFHLWWRARKQPEYLHHIPERFGHYKVQSSRPLIWLHTVSVGETRAAVSLVQRLRRNYPDHQILLSHTTPTGRATSESLFGTEVLRVYLPYDYPFAVRRFLQHFRPRIGVLLETEVWFNLIQACREANTPLVLLNARLSERSAKRYARFPRLTRQGLSTLSLIAAQTEVDANRLTSLCGRSVSVMGNLKFDIHPPASQMALGIHLRNLFGLDRPIFLAASTREGEEVLLLDALKQISIPDLLTVIVPRHPQRFNEVADLIQHRGYRMQRRSDEAAVHPETQVLLGDSMGEMFAYYTSCDIAFIGGSLLPFGGQNLIECCAVGRPVLIGPHTFNFLQVTDLAIACGAALRVQNAEDLIVQLSALLSSSAHRSAMSQRGQDFVSLNQGATEHAIELIAGFLSHSK